MYPRSVLLSAAAATIAAAAPGYSPARVFVRQDNINSTCYSYGIDFVNGGNYFINSQSNASFTCVSQFEGCDNDQADVMLVNDQNSNEYVCSTVATVPDDVSMMSTCPLSKSQMSSGDWSILVLGNNGDGMPFAYQRDISLTVGPQQTTTVTPTVTYSKTITPSVTITTTSVISDTTSITNSQTVTDPAATRFTTVTPKTAVVTSTQTITRTFRTWTKTQDIITVVVTPSCTVPARPYEHDPICSIVPTAKALPSGVHIGKRADRPMNPEHVRKRFENARERRDAALAAGHKARDLVGRSADAPTVTSTATAAVDTTTTITAATSTVSDIVLTTTTLTTTLPPVTVKAGTAVDTVTAPTPTKTQHTVTYTLTYVTKTMAVTWTYTTTTTPAASNSACRKQGGHFGAGGW